METEPHETSGVADIFSYHFKYTLLHIVWFYIYILIYSVIVAFWAPKPETQKGVFEIGFRIALT